MGGMKLHPRGIDPATGTPGQALVVSADGKKVEFGPSGGMTTEEIQDMLASFLVAGTNVTLTYDDAANTLTIAAAGGGLTAEEVRDAVAAFVVAGTNVTVTHDDVGDTLTIDATGGSGGGAVVLDDLTDVDTTTVAPATGDTLVFDGTIWEPAAASGGGGLTEEQVRDLVAAFVVAGANVTVTHDDPGDTLTIAAASGGGTTGGNTWVGPSAPTDPSTYPVWVRTP